MWLMRTAKIFGALLVFSEPHLRLAQEKAGRELLASPQLIPASQRDQTPPAAGAGACGALKIC